MLWIESNQKSQSILNLKFRSLRPRYLAGPTLILFIKRNNKSLFASKLKFSNNPPERAEFHAL